MEYKFTPDAGFLSRPWGGVWSGIADQKNKNAA